MTPNELILMHGRQLLRQPPFHTGEVHAMDTSHLFTYATRELLNVSLHIDLPGPDPDAADGFSQDWVDCIQPNVEWAEEHFLERVSGEPLNPAPSHVRWPYAQKNNSRHTSVIHRHGQHEWHEHTRADYNNHQQPIDNEEIQSERFSHTYPERFWPKFANEGTKRPNGRQVFVPHNGIRYEYGDLMDVVNLMNRSLYTRQAFLPVWFPEDTGATESQRVPCTIGYHFIVRPSGVEGTPDRLHVTYFMRSCDYVRYLRDDIYMAGRLGQWMSVKLNERGHTVFPDSLTLHITSLHSFVGDDWLIRKMVRSDAS